MTIVKKTEDSLTNMRNKYLKGGYHSSTVNMTHAINNMRISSENSNSNDEVDNNINSRQGMQCNNVDGSLSDVTNTRKESDVIDNGQSVPV